MTPIASSLDPASSGPIPIPAPSTTAAAPAAPRFLPVGLLADHARGGLRAIGLPVRRWLAVSNLRHDPILALALALALAVVLVDLVDGPADVRPSLVLAVAFLALQTALSPVRRAHRAMPLLRFALCLAFLVGASLAIDTHGGWPLLALAIPVVALAAAFGDESTWVAVAAVAVTLVPVALPATAADVRRRLIALVIGEIVTVVGSRQVVASLERSRDRLRRAQVLQRRRARQLAAVESVGRILAREGPTPAALDAVVGLLVDTFGYTFPSIYTWDGSVLRLGAQRNYDAPIYEFPMDRGVIGKVARTREAIFLPDVTVEPEYVPADNDVLGEIGVPLLADGELFGVLNVEMPGPRRLDDDDAATLKIVADRLAAALVLGRERQHLTERAQLMDQLASFSRSLGGSLDPGTVHEQVAAGAGHVIKASRVILVLLDRETGDYRIADTEGMPQALLGMRIGSGEGLTGRAIRDRAIVVEDHLDRSQYAPGAARASRADVVAALSAPLMVGDLVVGALTWAREDLRPFSQQEREVAGLLSAQVALAITNADLHHATEVAAVTDSLTGLHNRRHFDAAMVRLEAARRRDHEDERRPLSVVMFDLDHFGLMNKRHGHQVGDRVLKAFAEVVRRRVRASDLTARYGGEEFVVVLDGATRSEAVRVADEIRQTFEGIGFGLPDGAAVTCTVSAGCASLAAMETSGTVLIERADVGLAMAKSSGRNRVVAA